MSFDFLKCIDKWSSCIQRRVITEEEFAYKFFEEVGWCAPTEEELLSVFETLPEETMAELLRMLNICDKADHIPLPGIGGDNVSGPTVEQQIARAKAKHSKIKWACKLLKPKIEGRLAIEGSDSD